VRQAYSLSKKPHQMPVSKLWLPRGTRQELVIIFTLGAEWRAISKRWQLTFTRRNLTYNTTLRSVPVRYTPNNLISFHSTTAPTTIKRTSIFIKRPCFCQILTKYGLYRQIFLKSPTSNLTEIRPVGGALLPADRWTGIPKLRGAFHICETRLTIVLHISRKRLNVRTCNRKDITK